MAEMGATAQPGELEDLIPQTSAEAADFGLAGQASGAFSISSIAASIALSLLLSSLDSEMKPLHDALDDAVNLSQIVAMIQDHAPDGTDPQTLEDEVRVAIVRAYEAHRRTSAPSKIAPET